MAHHGELQRQVTRLLYVDALCGEDERDACSAARPGMTGPEIGAKLEPFLDAIAAHVAFGLGADPSDGGTGERMADARLAALGILRACGALGSVRDPAQVDAAARTLLANPPLLAAFFQNLDLLYDHGAPGAPEVSLVLMRAMEL